MAYENLGGVLLKDDRVSQAEEQFRKALGINPDDTEARNELGVATMQQGEGRGGDRALPEGPRDRPQQRRDPDQPRRRPPPKGEPENAANHFQHAAQVDPGSAKAHKNLAAAYLQERQWPDAVAQLQRPCRDHPGNAGDGTARLGAARAGRPDEAAAQFRKVLEIDDAHPGAHFALALSLMDAGRVDDAISHLERARGQARLRGGPRHARQRPLCRRGRWTRPLEHRRGLAEKPGDAQIQNDAERWPPGRGPPIEAVAHYSQGARDRPRLATAGESRQHPPPEVLAEAAAEYAKALEAEPGDAHLRNNLGIALVRDGRTAEAAAQFRKALEIDPAMLTRRGT